MGAPSVRACPYAARVDVTLLLIEDTTTLREATSAYLGHAGFRVLAVESGEQGLAAVASERVDLVLLDLMLPGMDGIEVCRRIRAESDTPIIMLTARSDTQDVVAGLEAGADDYVPKPFKSKELLARVRTRLRRQTEPGPSEHVRVGDLDIDVAGHQVRRGAAQIALTPLEFDLVVTLARQPWKVFTREELLEQVWGYQHAADTRLVNVHVQRLRAKIERDPEHPEIVLTVRGVGYRAGSVR